MRLIVLKAPWDYATGVAPLPAGASISSRLSAEAGFIHLFARSQAEFVKLLPGAYRALGRDGMLWVSWPKQASGVTRDLTENVIRDRSLAIGLVDVKVCAIDEVWSGLKLVRRLKDR
jgi:hypothetical protein